MVSRPARKRMYRTMQGKMVDIEKLRSANEAVRAVGNMNVNARGDVLTRSGDVMQTKAEVMREYYEQPKGVVSDVPTRPKPAVAPRSAPKPQPVKQFTPQPKKAVGQTTDAFKPKATAKPKTETKKGIDAALDGLE